MSTRSAEVTRTGGETPILVVRDVSVNITRRTLVANVQLTLFPKDVVAVMGPSGVGKSTLLACLAGITRPATGTVDVCGNAIWATSASQRARIRQKHIGFVFQFGELLAELNVLENVALPLRLMGTSRQDAEQAARSWLEAVGIAHLQRSMPNQLSGGETQRVAVCRAMVHGPSLVLADEPTGSLDGDNARRIAELLCTCVRGSGAALLFVTHDPEIAGIADRTLRILHGELAPPPQASDSE